MRIGLLTYHCVPNFGAQLQTLSTVGYLRKKGHEPIVLNWYPQDLENVYRWIISERSEQYKTHLSFATTYLPLSSLCRTEDELLVEIDRLDLDAILLGSDALFKYVPIRNRWHIKMGKYKPRLILEKVPIVERLHGNPFFGGFVSKMRNRVPVSVYAVSAQNTQFKMMSVLEKRLMKSYLSNFTMVSVRDSWTQNMVKEVTGLSSVEVFPDPVFAFNQNAGDYIPDREVILNKFGIQDNYILISFRTDNCSREYIQSLAFEVEKAGFTPVALSMPEGLNCAGIKPEISIPLSPLDWYALIKFASGYIGERMHPIVVSLHNSVPCYSFDEYGISSQSKAFSQNSAEWDKNSSKTYHILHAADLDSNWFAYVSKDKLPSPSSVIEHVMTFDRVKCQEFANTRFSLYEEGMDKTLHSFSEQ